MFHTENPSDCEGGESEMSYYNTCTRCGAHLDPGEKCDCREDNSHKTLFQRHKENYELEERLGGNKRCPHYTN